MSRLSDLYKAMETLRKEGVSTEDLEQKVGKLEVEIIQKEILPVVRDNIAPALKQVQRELVLVVDYLPGQPISVHLSRKRNITEFISDAVEILPDPAVEHKVGKEHEKQTKRAQKKGLCITYPSGEVLQMSKASDTLTEFIRRVGYQKVRALEIKVDRINLVSNSKDSKYSAEQHEVAKGWYVNTHSNNETKLRQINKISKALGIDVKAELIK